MEHSKWKDVGNKKKEKLMETEALDPKQVNRILAGLLKGKSLKGRERRRRAFF